MTTLAFVHGACVRDADWWWSAMVDPLSRRGIASVTVPLPSCGEDGAARGDLYDDIAACKRVIGAAHGPVILCGHSYGGVVITEAGAEDRVTQLLYVTSVMPADGQSQAGIVGDSPAPWMDPGDDGTVGVHPELIRELFLQDCDPTTTEQAIARLTRQSVAPFTQAPRRIAWRDTPASYVVCTQDLAIPADAQRSRIAPGARRVEFDAGHHPFLSRPNAFAELIAGEVARVP